MKFRAALLGLATWLPMCALAQTSWQTSLAQMPLEAAVTELNRTNGVQLMLRAFRSNEVVRALIFMPGATDEFYFWRRARATLTNASPTLLDAVIALTNQAYIQATFRPPFLLLHSPEDILSTIRTVKDEPTVERLKQAPFLPYARYYDYDWDLLQPILVSQLGAEIEPVSGSIEAYHFYRHSLAICGLTGWQALEAFALAGKTVFTVEPGRIVFEPDRRLRPTPRVK